MSAKGKALAILGAVARDYTDLSMGRVPLTRRSRATYAEAAPAIAEIKDSVARLMAATAFLLEVVGEPPERNCSCHVAPPCGDCVEWEGLRVAVKDAREALASMGGAP